MSDYAQALAHLQENVQTLCRSDAWKAALDYKAAFHQYSFNNCLLILSQNPRARQVAGYKKWQQLGRQVRKGEKGIMILAPVTRKMQDDDGEETWRLIGFRAVNVFDISQTDGDDPPETPAPKPLTADLPEIRAYTERLTAGLPSIGASLAATEPPRGNGMYEPVTGYIYLRADLPPLHRLKTLVHEAAHAILAHGPEGGRETAELEAESTAYLVCAQLGLDTGDYSFAYLANWSPTAEAILEVGARVTRAAEQLTGLIEAPAQAAAA